MSARITIQTHLLGDKRMGQIVDTKTLGNDETIQEVTGQNVKGVLTAMADGVQKDGNGRKVNEYVALQAYARGSVAEITSCAVTLAV